MRSHPQKIRRCGLIGIVTCLVWYWVDFHAIARMPFNSYWHDPEMAYMLSSLAVVKGYLYGGFYHHPGTPMMMAGTGIFGLHGLLASHGPESFVLFHLKNPGVFLTLAHALSALISIGCVAYLARRAVRPTDPNSVLPALAVASCYYALSPLSFASLTFWSHNALAPILGATLLVRLLRSLSQGREVPAREALALGAAAGFLTALQFLYATWVLSLVAAVGLHGLFHKANWAQIVRRQLLVVLGTVTSFFVCTLPNVKDYPLMYKFLVRITAHQEMHGTGPVGFTSLERLGDNFVRLRRGTPELIDGALVLVATVVVVMLLRRREFPRQVGAFAVASSVLAQFGVVLLLILKHPRVDYLPALAALSVALLAATFALLGTSQRRPRRFAALLSTAVLVLFLGNVFKAVERTHETVRRVTAKEREVSRALKTYAMATGKSPNTLTRVWMYGTAPLSLCFTLRSGDSWAEWAFATEIQQMCPHDLALRRNRTYLFRGKRLADIDWDVVISNRRMPAGLGHVVEGPYGLRLVFRPRQGVPTQKLRDLFRKRR